MSPTSTVFTANDGTKARLVLREMEREWLNLREDETACDEY
jgi:hypothetical protein